MHLNLSTFQYCEFLSRRRDYTNHCMSFKVWPLILWVKKEEMYMQSILVFLLLYYFVRTVSDCHDSMSKQFWARSCPKDAAPNHRAGHPEFFCKNPVASKEETAGLSHETRALELSTAVKNLMYHVDKRISRTSLEWNATQAMSPVQESWA